MTRAQVYSFVLATIVGLVCPASTSAQAIPVRRYTTEDGLAHDRVNCVVEDSRGFIWMCTPRGLSRFDGYGFATFDERHGLPSGSVNHVLESAPGEYWVATEAGVCRFVAAISHCEPYPFGTDSRDKRAVLLYRDRSGGLWAGTSGEVFKLDAATARFERVLLGPMPRRNLRAIAEDGLGAVWFALWTSVWQRLPDGTVHRRTFGSLPRDDGATALAVDKDGRLWVGHRSGLIVLPPSLDVSTPTDVPADAIALPEIAGQGIRLRAVDGLSLTDVRALEPAEDGSIWIALADGGVLRFAEGRFARVPAPRGLDTFNVVTFATDRAGYVWAGTLADGAVKLARQRFVTYDESRGLAPASILSIFEDRSGAIVVVTGDGTLGRFAGERFSTVSPNLPANFVSRVTQLGPMALQDRSGAWWFRTGHELFRFNVPRFEALAHAEPSLRTASIAGFTFDGFSRMRIFEDSRGDVWIGASSNRMATLTRWDHETGAFERRPLPAGVPFPPSYFAEDRDGNVWLGLAFGGLARCSRKECAAIELGALQDAQVNGFYLDEAGRLWAAAGQAGLLRIEDPGGARPTLARYTAAQGFTGHIVRSVTGDRAGRLYVGTESGIDRLDLATGRIKHFTTADGLAADEQQVAFRDRQGRLWFGTVGGLSSYVPPQEESSQPPPVHISAVRIAGAPQPLSAVGEAAVTGLQVADDRNQLQIDFASVAGAGHVLGYQYRLAGIDADWSVSRPERSVTYARLPAGTYRFSVRAVNEDGQSSPVPATIDFRVLAPFWRQGWFVATGLALVVLAAAGTYRFRMRRLIELERLRTRIASDLHDDMGATLSQIAILGEVARARAGAVDPGVEEPLARISTLSRESVDAMSDIVWAIDPHKDRMENLAQRMRRHASDVLPPLGIPFTFDVADEHVTLGADVRREVFLAFKESLNNAIKHADCRSVSVALRAEASSLVLTVADDGRGFDPACVTPGHGLGSLRRRAESLGGSLHVESQGGTRVTFRIPYRGRRTHLNR